jgi:hypothetical protein
MAANSDRYRLGVPPPPKAPPPPPSYFRGGFDVRTGLMRSMVEADLRGYVPPAPRMAAAPRIDRRAPSGYSFTQEQGSRPGTPDSVDFVPVSGEYTMPLQRSDRNGWAWDRRLWLISVDRLTSPATSGRHGWVRHGRHDRHGTGGTDGRHGRTARTDSTLGRPARHGNTDGGHVRAARAGRTAHTDGTAGTPHTAGRSGRHGWSEPKGRHGRAARTVMQPNQAVASTSPQLP